MVATPIIKRLSTKPVSESNRAGLLPWLSNENTTNINASSCGMLARALKRRASRGEYPSKWNTKDE